MASKGQNKVKALAELVAKLQELGAYGEGDAETTHALADQALVDYIDDPEVAKAYEALEKWYA